MSEPVAGCPLCGSNANRPFDQRHINERLVTNIICVSCGLVYQSPRMAEKELQAFYESDYRRLVQGQEGPSPKDLAIQAARGQAALEFISSRVRECAHLLDIGCSAGILLQKFSSHFQCQSTGIEPGTSYREYAQSQGLQVYSSLEEIKQGQETRFDLVSMMHVLEHLPEPVEYLQELNRKYLKPAGWLLVEVPNLYAHDCFEVAHLVSFSTHTLVQVIQKAGFEIARIEAHGTPRSRLIPLYIRLLARSADTAPYTLKPEHMVRIKRQAGFLYRRVATHLFPKRAWIDPARLGGK